MLGGVAYAPITVTVTLEKCQVTAVSVSNHFDASYEYAAGDAALEIPISQYSVTPASCLVVETFYHLDGVLSGTAAFLTASQSVFRIETSDNALAGQYSFRYVIQQSDATFGALYMLD